MLREYEIKMMQELNIGKNRKGWVKNALREYKIYTDKLTDK